MKKVNLNKLKGREVMTTGLCLLYSQELLCDSLLVCFFFADKFACSFRDS